MADIIDKTEETVKADKVVKADKPKTRRPSKGQATHIRRMKQEARKEGVVYRPEIQ